MSTFLEMRNKIEDDLLRTDLTSQVNREINRAIRKYARSPMWFSSTDMDFATAINQQSYDTDDGLPSDIRKITYVRLDQSTATIVADTGAADAYVIAAATTITAYTNGAAYTFKAANANTGASTLNIDAVGVKNIVRPNAVALKLGDIKASEIITVVYNSTNDNFQLRPSGANYYPVKETAFDNIQLWNANNNPGLPLNYAWFEKKIYFYPIPDQVYNVTIFYDKYYADLAADGDSNDFTTNPEAEQLIEAEAEFQLFASVIGDDGRAQVQNELRKEALKELRIITKQFNGVSGNIRATTF